MQVHGAIRTTYIIYAYRELTEFITVVKKVEGVFVPMFFTNKNLLLL